MALLLLNRHMATMGSSQLVSVVASLVAGAPSLATRPDTRAVAAGCLAVIVVAFSRSAGFPA